MHEDPPFPIWKDLMVSLKRQHLITLQKAFNDTARCLSI